MAELHRKRRSIKMVGNLRPWKGRKTKNRHDLFFPYHRSMIQKRWYSVITMQMPHYSAQIALTAMVSLSMVF